MTDAPPTHSHPRSFKRLLPTFFKLAIAVLAIWFVLRGVAWNDVADLPPGTTLNQVTFPQGVHARVLSEITLPAPPSGNIPAKTLVHIQFPDTPVLVEVDGKSQQVIIDDQTPVEGGGVLGLAREKDVPLEMLEGQHIHEGLKTLAVRASAKWYLMLAAWGMLVIPFIVTAIRWRNLMRPQGIEMPLGKCLQLTFVGQFYSILLPGITGGDLVKILYAARLTGSKTKSFITIILDRVIGLVALMVIAGTSAGVQLYLNQRQPQGLAAATSVAATGMDNTLLNVFLMIVSLLLVMLVACVVYFSHRLRRLVGIEWFLEHLGTASEEEAEGRAKLEHLFRVHNLFLLAFSVLIAAALALLRFQFHLHWAQDNAIFIYIGLIVCALFALAALAGLLLHNSLVDHARPLIGKVAQAILRVDETLHVYRGHFGLLFWAFVISVISQLTLPLSAWLSGTALGMHAPVTYYMAYVPLAILAASLPISPPQGLGFLEWVLNHFFVSRGTATASQAFALTQAVRFLPLLWNLCGAWWVLTGKYSRNQDTQPPDKIAG